MASIINTNLSSLNAQRNLMSSQNSLATSMQRLSSGLRINSAKDDAAGLAISERMTAQIKGLTQAGRNANDGISLAQTAEGALSTIGNNLQRIRELAVQSRNATNSTDDRAALQKEVIQLKSEIDRVATQTSFNGTKLLDGSFTAQTFQVGANQGETISIAGIANSTTASLGSWTSGATTTYTQTTASATATVPGSSFSMSINGVNIAAPGQADAAGAATALKTYFDAAKAANPSALANVSMAADGKITSTDATLTISNLVNIGGVTAGTTNGAATVVAGTAQTGIGGVDISTQAGADNALLAMDAALKSINSSRADLGAIQNRFESVVSNLATTAENLTASRSRIQDADFAAETANLSRSQILQQAGTAMVAQANQLPQTVMSLLR
ncbi:MULTISPECIES: flagellin [unclassified Variovorax]|uniref:flagellin n=1 Tax=unclassified Variovorax TaxID=663243 RepID=UPI002576EA38|nr:MULTISPECIES: flagellin [unclassified Variovorax]MDM0089783.1 flagellin [Variovorax sp. J22G40]MDM0148551.1 flagellin [Variovorax sp. J2P1-31]